MNKINAQKRFSPFILTGLYVLCVIMASSTLHADAWQKLEQDGLHDPESAGLSVLQQPEEALSVLPSDTAGNMVDWVKALRDNYIQPRSYLHVEKKLEILDSNILMKGTGDAPYVLFPHKAHTEWLECSNCHEKLFISKAGATQIKMLAILQGEACGRCHGAVSFPLTECNRCHSVSQESATKTKK